LNKIRYARQMQ